MQGNGVAGSAKVGLEIALIFRIFPLLFLCLTGATPAAGMAWEGATWHLHFGAALIDKKNLPEG